jgi:hypothetical protein
MTDSIRLNATEAARRSQAPPSDPARTATAADKPVRLLGWLSGIGIGLALLIMIGASLVRQNWMIPPVPMPSPGPPWELPVHVSGGAVSILLWLSALIAAGGLAAGLLAARRGARGPIRLILIGAAVAAVLLTVLPPAGSTDPLDYAAYGRLALLGHNPYVATPLYLRVTDPTFGLSVPVRWQSQVSLYGPAATIEQYLAARLGGNSMARVVFWLKLWNTIAFGVVAFVLDRLLRARPSARLRAHLLWTINPLLLWDLLASGHMDVVAAGAGMIGLLALGRQQPGVEPRLWRAAAAGALVGFAADVKIDYALFGLGLIWALRRSLPALIAAAAGALAVLGPTYAWLGKPAFAALFARGDKTTQDSFYRVAALTDSKYLLAFAALLVVILAALLLWRMPPGDQLRPALRPALALAVAWVFIWPYTLPWYDAMIIVVLVLYPATWLDWLVLARLAGATIANIPGNPDGVPGHSHALKMFDVYLVHYMAPLVLLGAAGALLIMIVGNVWGLRPEVNRASASGRGRPSPRGARALTGALARWRCWPRGAKCGWRRPLRSSGGSGDPAAESWPAARRRRERVAGARLRRHLSRRRGAGRHRDGRAAAVAGRLAGSEPLGCWRAGRAGPYARRHRPGHQHAPALRSLRSERGVQARQFLRPAGRARTGAPRDPAPHRLVRLHERQVRAAGW